MKNLKILALIAAMSFSGAVFAQSDTTKPSGTRGKVESVSGTTITVKSKSGETTIQTDANTTFTLDGQPATLADVKEGERVMSVTPAEGVATEVKLATAHKKKKTEPTTSPSNG